MTYLKNIFALIAVVLLWGACKKAELPPSLFEDPVFSVACIADTGSLNVTLTAGKDDIYLFTEFEAADFIICTGTFSGAGCPDGNCPGSLAFSFRSPMTDDFMEDTVFHIGSYVFEGAGSAADTLYLTTFNVVPNSGYDSYTWDIDSVFAGEGASLVREFQDDAPRTVLLTAQKQSGLTSAVSHTISLTSPGESYPIVGIDVQSDSAFYTLTAEISGSPVSQFLWNTGDTSQIIYSTDLAMAYSITVEDDFGVDAEAEIDQLTINDLPVSTAGFTYDVQKIVIPGMEGEVSVQWVDGQGNIWRSDFGAQPPGATFQVLESEPYEVNERGQKTRKMRITFDCLLFNDAGESLAFSGAGVIAVAHP